MSNAGGAGAQGLQDSKGALVALSVELGELKTRFAGVMAVLGERALPKLRNDPEFADLAQEAEVIKARMDALSRREEDLKAEIAGYEKEERERAVALTCMRCGLVNPDGSRFCEQCGDKVGELPREYCRNCGTLNRAGQKFCGECGRRLE